MTVRTRKYEENRVIKAKGIISTYQHRGPLKFVPYGDDDPTHGYFVTSGAEIVAERHSKNLIVDEASVYMAKRMRPGASWGAGIGFLEVGTGVGSGDTQNPEAESPAQIALRVPLLRKAIGSWTCLDTNGDPTVSDTNVLQLTTTFDNEEAIGPIVEMGLFGGDATITEGSGQMFNYKVFKVINKDEEMQLTVVWKLTF